MPNTFYRVPEWIWLDIKITFWHQKLYSEGVSPFEDWYKIVSTNFSINFFHLDIFCNKIFQSQLLHNQTKTKNSFYLTIEILLISIFVILPLHLKGNRNLSWVRQYMTPQRSKWETDLFLSSPKYIAPSFVTLTISSIDLGCEFESQCHQYLDGKSISRWWKNEKITFRFSFML